MLRPLFTLTLLFPALLAGCHCMPVSAIYDNAVDNLSDGLRELPAADGLYVEDLDIQRCGVHCQQHHIQCPATYPRHRPR